MGVYARYAGGASFELHEMLPRQGIATFLLHGPDFSFPKQLHEMLPRQGIATYETLHPPLEQEPWLHEMLPRQGIDNRVPRAKMGT